jgi:hypothetical protein
MEGNSLSLEQTDLVINEGQTISEKVCESIWKPLTIRKHLFIKKVLKECHS